jgi:glycerol uptake facilitator-like aquaporin
MTTLRQKGVAEALGTFALVFAGTGAIVINDASGGAALAIFACRGCQQPECCPLPSKQSL